MDEGLYTVQIVSKQLHSSKQENNNINVVELIKYATEEDCHYSAQFRSMFFQFRSITVLMLQS